MYYTEYKSYSAKKVTWQKVTWQSRWAWYTQLPDMAEKLRHGVVGVSLLVAVVLGVAVAAACRQVMHSNSSAAEQVTSSEVCCAVYALESGLVLTILLFWGKLFGGT